MKVKDVDQLQVESRYKTPLNKAIKPMHSVRNIITNFNSIENC